MNTFIYTLNDPDTLEVKYVGKSNIPRQRLTQHIWESKSGKSRTRKCNWIKSLISKGKRPILEIIMEIDVDEYPKWEEFAIKFYSDIGCKLTNSDSTGQGNTNRLKEITDKIAKYHNKKVFQYDLNGIFIKKFCSVREASRILKIDHTGIIAVCNNKRTQTHNFVFTYKKTIFKDIKTNSKEVKRPVQQFERDGSFVSEFSSIAEASKKTGFLQSNISKNCNNKIKTYKNYVFKFKQ